MVRTIDSIVAELNPAFDTQRNSITERLNLLPQEQEAQVQGLRAQRDEQFGDITRQANRRGSVFDGFKPREQARFDAQAFSPALANLTSQFNDRRAGLQDQLGAIDATITGQAQAIRQQELDRDFAAREAAASRAAASAAASQPSAIPSLIAALTGGGQQQNPAVDAQNFNISGEEQDAFNDVAGRLESLTPEQLLSDYNATKVSAGFGNVRDQFKLEFYTQLAPDLFGSSVPVQTLSNGGQLSF